VLETLQIATSFWDQTQPNAVLATMLTVSLMIRFVRLKYLIARPLTREPHQNARFVTMDMDLI
jgi:hypothetical protein